MRPYDLDYYSAHCVLGVICCGLGGWAFGAWQGSTAAGWFMFFALDAVASIAFGLYCIAYKPHGGFSSEDK